MQSEDAKGLALNELSKIFLILGCGASLLVSQLSGSDSKVNPESRVLLDFSKRVQSYVMLHKQLESSLPPLKQTAEPAKIVEHQQLLASKIRSARINAVEGEIFTPDVRKVLSPIIRQHFRGPYAAPSHSTIREGNPVKMRLQINEVYPDGVPWTTVPPSLLQNLPRLPKEVEYRIVDRDLILWDDKANVVVEVFRQAIPAVSPSK
jgi:hypothetical protein